MSALREYLDDTGRSPFGRWFAGLDSQAAIKITTALTRMATGNLSNTKGVGGGVTEFRIHTGPGYRIYFGREGKTVIILLGGGTKARQQSDIATAKANWQDFRNRNRRE